MNKLDEEKINSDLDISRLTEKMSEANPNDVLLYVHSDEKSGQIVSRQTGTAPKVIEVLTALMRSEEGVKVQYLSAIINILAGSKKDREIFNSALKMACKLNDAADKAGDEVSREEVLVTEIDGNVLTLANIMNDEKREGEGLLYCRAHNKTSKLDFAALVGDPNYLGTGIVREMRDNEQFKEFFQQVVAVFFAENTDEYAKFGRRVENLIKEE